MHFASLDFDYEHGEGVTYTITATGGLNNDPTYNAEYVDVEYDGIHRTTGSSMDLGSFSFGGSMRGPGSLTGSMGRSPRSPLRSPLLPRSPLGGSLATPAGFEQPPDLALKVGSAPAASAGATAAAAALAGRSGSSRLRPGGAAVGCGFRTANGLAAPAAPAAGDGVVVDGVDGVNGDSRRLAAGQHLSSFSVRVSNETGSDSGDGPVEDGPGSAGPGSGSEVLPLLSNSGASSSDAGRGNSSGSGSGSSRRGGRGRRGGKGKGKK